jgi:hypothetical protein
VLQARFSTSTRKSLANTLQHFSENPIQNNMASPAAASTQTGPFRSSSSRSNSRRWIIVVLIVTGILFGAAGFYYMRVLSFSEKAVLRDLAEASGMKVTARSYHRTHFPAPGGVLDGIEFRNQRDDFTLLHIDHLVIKSTYLGLLRHHVTHVKAVGAHIFVPPFGSNFTFRTQHSNIVLDEIIANGALVEFVTSDTNHPLVFDVHDALLTNVRWGIPIRYRLKFHNPQPPGEISVTGTFGPWSDGHPENTPLTGDFFFDHADLSVYGGIQGLLEAHGRFAGMFHHIDVQGVTETPDFEVASGGHKVSLGTHFDGYVDAMHGDTFLNRVEAHWGRTTVIAEGSVAGSEGKKGKSGRFTFTARHGRIEDILGLFVSSPRSPMSGELSFHTGAEIPPGDQPFLKKVSLNGKFGIDQGSFGSPDTQNNIDTLSAGAQGKSKDDPETVLIGLKGIFNLSGGTTRFAELSFGVPGADAKMHGTYNILNYKIDLHGQMRVDKQISKTSSGVKSFVLKLMDPLFKKKKRGEIVPVHIEGTYQKPQCGLDLLSGSKQTPVRQ